MVLSPTWREGVLLIVIEGVDKCGKSTLAAALAERLADTPGDFTAVRHCSKPERHPLEEYEVDLDAYRPGVGMHVIYDRHAWGERVWPTIFGRDTEYTDEMHLHVELYLRSRGALMIHAVAGAEAIASRRTEDDLDASKVDLALSLFRDVRRGSFLPCLRYDFAHGDFEESVNDFVDGATALEDETAEVFDVTPHWVGTPRPDLLLVGDEPGPTKPDDQAVPFRPWGGTVGPHLLGLNLPWHRIALANARSQKYGDTPLWSLWHRLGSPAVVALGNEAKIALLAEGVPAGAVPHPQWVRRFHYSKLPAYAALIKSAAETGHDLREAARAWT